MDELSKLLDEEIVLLNASVLTLNLSYEKCKLIDLKADLTFEEMESIDSLTSKFGRTSDIFTQKLLRTVWSMLHEAFVPFIDLMNKAEKYDIINSANELIYIRDLRNQIAHEYIPEAIKDMTPEVLDYIPKLIANIEQAIKFINNRN